MAAAGSIRIDCQEWSSWRWGVEVEKRPALPAVWGFGLKMLTTVFYSSGFSFLPIPILLLLHHHQLSSLSSSLSSSFLFFSSTHFVSFAKFGREPASGSKHRKKRRSWSHQSLPVLKTARRFVFIFNFPFSIFNFNQSDRKLFNYWMPLACAWIQKDSSTTTTLAAGKGGNKGCSIIFEADPLPRGRTTGRLSFGKVRGQSICVHHHHHHHHHHHLFLSLSLSILHRMVAIASACGYFLFFLMKMNFLWLDFLFVLFELQLPPGKQKPKVAAEDVASKPIEPKWEEEKQRWDEMIDRWGSNRRKDTIDWTRIVFADLFLSFAFTIFCCRSGGSSSDVGVKKRQFVKPNPRDIKKFKTSQEEWDAMSVLLSVGESGYTMFLNFFFYTKTFTTSNP